MSSRLRHDRARCRRDPSLELIDVTSIVQFREEILDDIFHRHVSHRVESECNGDRICLAGNPCFESHVRNFHDVSLSIVVDIAASKGRGSETRCILFQVSSVIPSPNVY